MSPVLKCHAETHINAPASLVYSLLTDLSQWPVWNEMVPQVTIAYSPSADSANTDMRMRLGQRLQFHVRMPMFGVRRHVPGGSVEEIVRLDPAPTDSPSRVEWNQRGIPQTLLRTNRVNIIEPSAEVDGRIIAD
ncbi:hypothetical protein EJ05DRAFT_501190 [Pseudovirgaria hyperparasitica]|uniref:Coenzyme Q-binding protein COQ10 START domain-containing protein n=1 Tax=Pseudovirgaria hyperparasitica TaxID=470096 RepID=A0A6A6W4Z3_9PEZI|nr:uncharacterized protein EJ05DRAFT_501190 [Pseudovirgaria hyperparasitica]KAF2757663.1 hypothetical protein EJ05DRAFT_501190 [Pseudovirgaria hyperparasitica]